MNIQDPSSLFQNKTLIIINIVLIILLFLILLSILSFWTYSTNKVIYTTDDEVIYLKPVGEKVLSPNGRYAARYLYEPGGIINILGIDCVYLEITNNSDGMQRVLYDLGSTDTLLTHEISWRFGAIQWKNNETIILEHQSKRQYRVPRYEINCFPLFNALKLFHRDIGRYPTTEEGIIVLHKDPGISGWKGPYLDGLTISDVFKKKHPGYLDYKLLKDGSIKIATVGPDGVMDTEDDCVCVFEQTSLKKPKISKDYHLRVQFCISE